MTRSYKANDRDHAGIAAGSASPQERLPRYFAKNGALDTDPKSVKKEGNGKGNWGCPGTEAQDYGYTFSPSQTRRRSNSSATADLSDFKTKFELDDEPVFEEEIHGPLAGTGGMNRTDTASSSGMSVDEEHDEHDGKH